MSAAAPHTRPWAMHAALLRQPWQARRNRRSWLMLSLVPALALGVPVALGLALRLQAGNVLMMCGLVLLVLFWHLQVDGLLRQNRYALARLVPGHAQTLLLSLLVQGLLVTAAAVLVISLGSSLQLRWLWLCLIVVVMLAWLVREPMGWIVFGLLSPLVGELPRWTQQLAGLPWGVQALGLGSLVLLLAACAGQGGAWHLWSDLRQRRMQRSIDALSQGETAAAVDQGRLGRAVTRCYDWPQRAWRRRVIAGGPRLPMGTRLGVALGTGGAMPALLWLGLWIAAALGGMMWAQQVSWSLLAEPGRLGICIGLFSMLAGVLSGRLDRLWTRRREQALMLLLPGCPRGADVAGLEQRWRAQALLLWAGLTALALAITHQGGAASRDFVLFVALLCLPLPWAAQWRARRLNGKPSPWVFGPWPALAGVAGLAAAPLGITAAWSLGAALAVVLVAEGLVRRDPRPPLPLPAGRCRRT